MQVKGFKVVVEKDEDGWLVADVPKLQGCHTQAKTLKSLRKNIAEAIELHLECMKSLEKKNASTRK